MSKEMLINVSEGEECRIALLDDGRLEELYMERTSATSHVGNIYKGRVTNVEASIQAAFVDFGLGRNGFLHISDLMPSYFGGGNGRGGDDFQESVGRKMSRRDRPPIQRCLRRGDEIIVQIIKEGIGTKGPTLSTYISIPGRILVMMPGMAKFGVSRKIEDEDERRRLRQILDSLKPIDDVGFIIRTAGIGKTKTDIQRDLTYLTRLWSNIERKRQDKAPVELYTEGDLVTRTVRDVFSADLDRIVVDNADVAKRIAEFFKIAMPRAKNRIELYEGPVPLFHQAGIERELEQMYSRHVPLPSGGSLVIDSTEAVVAIDVNSGKFREHNDAEMTAFKTDMEAADEIPRQLKLRDLGGVIICDFIDLRFERNRRELEKRLHDNFRNDRAKTKVLRMSQFGIIELTRQRMRPSLKHSIYFDCPHCKGAGVVKTPESMSLNVMRRLAIAAHDPRVARIELTVCPDVGVYVLNKKRSQLTALETSTKKRIIVRQDIELGLDETRLELFDARDGSVYLEDLNMSPVDSNDDSRRRQQPHGRQIGRDRRPQQGRPLPVRSPAPVRGGDDDVRDDLDSAEDAVEDRELSRELPPLTADHVPPVPAQPVPPVLPRLPIGRVEGRLIDLDTDVPEEESSVIDVDEPNEPLGDGPEPYEDDRYDRNRSRNQNDRNDRRPPQRPPARQPVRPPARQPVRPPEPAQRNLPDNEGNAAEQRPAGDAEEFNPDGTRRRRRRRGRRGRGGRGRTQSDQPHLGEPGIDPQGQPVPPGSVFNENEDDDFERPSAESEITIDEADVSVASVEDGIVANEPGDVEVPGDADATGDATGDDGSPKKRRRRRGGRRHRRRRDGADDVAGEVTGEVAGVKDESAEEGPIAAGIEAERADTEAEAPEAEPVEEAPAKPARKRRPAATGARKTPRASRKAPASTASPAAKEEAPPAPIVRTGSTDRHLVLDDEPVDPEPVIIPRSVRDLDDVPDDFD